MKCVKCIKCKCPRCITDGIKQNAYTYRPCPCGPKPDPPQHACEFLFVLWVRECHRPPPPRPGTCILSFYQFCPFSTGHYHHHGSQLAPQPGRSHGIIKLISMHVLFPLLSYRLTGAGGRRHYSHTIPHSRPLCSASHPFADCSYSSARDQGTKAWTLETICIKSLPFNRNPFGAKCIQFEW